MSDIISNTLKSSDETLYGEKYKDHILEQYKIYLNMTDKISERRYTMNNFFMTINTGIISVIGIAGFYDKNKMTLNKDYVSFLTISLLLFCYVWYRLIRSYKDLNSAKFKVIHEIEKYLPLKPFDAEWEALARGKDESVYLQFSKIEKYVPIVFALVHLLLSFYIFLYK